ncbi:TfoX/Sxy family protein [Nitrospira defluvii]|nr:TfoX/Sxy family protein [Nitrospira defluvii]
MAKIYLEKLTTLTTKLEIAEEISKPIEIKHFFSGAALYINKTICASWSPVGLAFKLPEKEVDKLINNGKAIPLKYFPKGHVKKGYALFENPDDEKPSYWKKHFKTAAKQV